MKPKKIDIYYMAYKGGTRLNPTSKFRIDDAHTAKVLIKMGYKITKVTEWIFDDYRMIHDAKHLH